MPVPGAFVVSIARSMTAPAGMSTAATSERWCFARLLHSLAMTVFSAEPSAVETFRMPAMARARSAASNDAA